MIARWNSVCTVAYLSLGDCLATTGRHAEADAVLKKCLALDGAKVKDIRSHVTAKKSCALRLGRMFAAIGKHQQAVKVYESAVVSEGSLSQVPDNCINLMGFFFLFSSFSKVDSRVTVT